ncbi:helix-turn-helix domain-containing protein [Hydrogenophaga aquatica]
MARPSKLSPEQWQEIERRLAAGERAADLSREYGISQTRISERVSKVSEKVKETAHKLAEAQTALAELPVAQQYAAVSLAEKLRAISVSLANAAELGAKTAHRLHALANSEVEKVDDADPLLSMEALKGVSVLTKLANDSSQIAVNLLAANRDTVKQVNAPPENEAPKGVLVVPGVMDEKAWEKMMNNAKDTQS